MDALKNDMCRCYGEDCEHKSQCLRHLTMIVDPPEVLSYALSLADDQGVCDAFIENKSQG